MKNALVLLASWLLLVGCNERTIDPRGTYSLATDQESYTLTIADGGRYRLKNEHGGETVEGSWKKEPEHKEMLSLSGIVWHGLRARRGNGYWVINLALLRT